MPSIASFMDITFPRERQFEIDGAPLTGKISAIQPTAQFKDGKIDLTWKAIDKKGQAKIWLSTTNYFQTGQTDNYVLIKKVPVDGEKATIDVSAYNTSFYKIVLEMPHNTLNRWVVLEKK